MFGCKQVKPEVDAALQGQLEAMGFSANKAVRALHFTGTSSLEQAVAWLVEHGEDADIDTPLLIPKVKDARVSSCTLLHLATRLCMFELTGYNRCDWCQLHHAGRDQAEAVAGGGKEGGRGEVAASKGKAPSELVACNDAAEKCTRDPNSVELPP